MAYVSRNFFTEDKKTQIITAVLYLEKLPDNWADILGNNDYCPYKWFISPAHTPDNKDRKPHRHLVLMSRSRDDLSFNSVHLLLTALNGEYSKPLCVTGGHDGLVRICRYGFHLTKESMQKEQFDFTDPDYFDGDYPEDGIINGKLNVFHSEKGFRQSDDFDVFKVVRKTVREQSEFRKSFLDSEREIVLSHIYEVNETNFSCLTKWCIDNEHLDVLRADCFMFKCVLNDMIDYIEEEARAEDRANSTEKAVEEVLDDFDVKVLKRSINKMFDDISGTYAVSDDVVLAYVRDTVHNNYDVTGILTDTIYKTRSKFEQWYKEQKAKGIALAELETKCARNAYYRLLNGK